VLIPRREVANTIAYRRRKGTLALLELLGNDVAGWPATAVEFFKLLGWNQNINHLHLERAKTTDVRQVVDLDLVNDAFDPLAHTVEVRRINSNRTIGRYNIPSVGLFAWRLKSYSVTRSQPRSAEDVQRNRYTFSVLGQDAPLFMEPASTDIEEMNLPKPIRRLAFARNPEGFYGAEKSFAIWADGWAGFDPAQPVPVEAIIPADLSDWQYTAPLKHVLVDPVLGRFAFPPDQGQSPAGDVLVNYHYGFSADIGGGEYIRPILDPSPQQNPSDAIQPKFYLVGEGQQLRRLSDAVDHWLQDKPQDAVIEITDSSVYVEAINLVLDTNQTLQLRAGNGHRPVIQILEGQTDLSDALTVTMQRDSRFTLDGLLVTGRGVRINGPKPQDLGDPISGARVVIRHCTLVPGWGLESDCKPSHPAEASLELYDVRATVTIDHSIIGSIQIHEEQLKDEPIPVCITDSILDATAADKEAVGAPGYAVAHAVVTIKRCTVFGIIDVHAVELAENCIFNDGLNVERRQLGCMRFCHVPPGCRTPRRYHCQPDLVAQVKPQFNSMRYGTPTYCHLADTCADEIKRGADDESEMGAFHDLFEPQRNANLRARLEEFTPAGMDVGFICAT
jgi:hypothetical protein